jgi:hypothetical protein
MFPPGRLLWAQIPIYSSVGLEIVVSQLPVAVTYRWASAIGKRAAPVLPNSFVKMG